MEKVITLEEFNELFEEYNHVVRAFAEMKSSISSSINDLEDKFCSFSYLIGMTKSFRFVDNKNTKCYCAGSSIKFDEATCEYSWGRNLPINTTKASYYGKFVKDVLELFNPLIIRIPSKMLPVVSFSDLFVPTGKAPIEGNYICGEVKGIPVILDNNLSNNVEVESVDGEIAHIKVYTSDN